MADIKLHWVKTDYPIKISDFANNIGFNLQSIDFEGISDDKWEWIDSKIRNKIMSYLDECWEENNEQETALSHVKKGVYVITLSGNISIDYDGKPSKVIYIGRGHIRSRIYNHLKNWIRYLSDSLQDISLNIWMTEIKVKGSSSAFKEVETDLLNYFYDKYQQYPLQNSKSGDYHEKQHEYSNGWNLPLHNPTNIQNGWAVRPLRNNNWAIEFNEDF